MKKSWWMMLVVGGSAALGAAQDDDVYTKSVEAWRAGRVERLTARDGWLALIGLHFLEVGENTVGSGADNKVRLAAGPGRVGVVSVSSEGKVSIVLDAAAGARVDGEAVKTAELSSDELKPSVVTCGTVSFFAIVRGGKIALRVKDSAAERRKQFVGIDYFPVDPSWRIEAQWVAFATPRFVPFTNIIGNVSREPVPGKAVFTREGKTVELLPILETGDEPLFFVFSDQTSGSDTYGAARFLYAKVGEDGKVVLDFNRAYNPPCAFTPFATCPLPPKENQMPFRVGAGEKKYRGGHE